jgi:hypothetical protein
MSSYFSHSIRFDRISTLLLYPFSPETRCVSLQFSLSSSHIPPGSFRCPPYQVRFTGNTVCLPRHDSGRPGDTPSLVNQHSLMGGHLLVNPPSPRSQRQFRYNRMDVKVVPGPQSEDSTPSVGDLNLLGVVGLCGGVGERVFICKHHRLISAPGS